MAKNFLTKLLEMDLSSPQSQVKFLQSLSKDPTAQAAAKGIFEGSVAANPVYMMNNALSGLLERAKGEDGELNAADVADIVANPARAAQDAAAGAYLDPLKKQMSSAKADEGEEAEPAERDKDSYMERFMNATIDKGREAQMKSFQDALEDGLREPAEEAADETAAEVAEMAALAEQEESPSMSDDYAGMPEDGSSVESKEAAEAPKAEAVYTPEQAQELFKVAHGSDFDPKSEMDKRKMKEIEETLVEQGGLGDKSPNRFALDIYRKYKYV